MMKHGITVAIVLAASITAFAGKEQREMIKNEVNPALREAEGKFKASCGCALKITFDENAVKSNDELYQFKHVAESITENAPKYCTDAASKKAVCQMKTLTLAKAAESKFSFKNGNGLATTDGSSYIDWDLITRELDK